MAVTNIRQGIFETNSSSVHVLCINKKELNIPESFAFENDGEFGWSSDTYYDDASKGSYIYHILDTKIWHNTIAEYKQNHPDYNGYGFDLTDDSEYIAISKKYRNQYQNQITSILNEYGCKTVRWVEYTGPNAGYLDHSYSAIPFLDDMLRCPDLLIHFLFGDGTINTGNDNDDYSYPTVDRSCYEYVFEKGN